MTLEDLYEGEFLRRNSLSSTADQGENAPFSDYNLRDNASTYTSIHQKLIYYQIVHSYDENMTDFGTYFMGAQKWTNFDIALWQWAHLSLFRPLPLEILGLEKNALLWSCDKSFQVKLSKQRIQTIENCHCPD